MVSCCVKTCKLKNKKSKYHRLPTADSELCQLWISRIGNEDLMKKDTKQLTNCRICHRHFHEMCKLNTRLGLKEFSVPTLYLPNFQGESTPFTCFLSATTLETGNLKCDCLYKLCVSKLVHYLRAFSKNINLN